MHPHPGATSSIDYADRLHAILESKHLTLHQISQQSEVHYGHSSPYFLPHNLYYDLRTGRFSPSIYQMSFLSRVSNYLLNDWLRAFGFNVEDISRMQVILPSNRTVLLNSSLDDPQAWVPWLENKLRDKPVPPIAPLVELVEFADRKRLGSISGPGNRDSLYVKVGGGDALAFPDLLPGSIVRADPTIANDLLLRGNGTTSDRMFLIEHSKGLCCCRLRIVGDSLIVPVSTQLPYAQIEFQLPQEAKVIGVADFEIRPLVRSAEPEVSKELAKRWKPRSLVQETGLGQLLRKSRTKMDLSLREASLMSHQIVVLLDDQRYFVSPSSLSDFEVLDTPPRHFHKAITLCSLYGLQFYSFLKTIGIDPETLGKEPMPDQLVGRPSVEHGLRGNEEPRRGGFVEELLGECGEVPFFLRNSSEILSGLADVSLDDCFWVGREPNPLHPYLTHALLVIVNRRKRKPVYFRSKSLWEQPLYVVLKRDGTYLCACCGIENGSLVVHPYSPQFYSPTQLRYPDDAEIVGQVVTIARKLV